MNITTFDTKRDLEIKQKKYEYDLIKDNHKKYYNNVEYKSQLLNIDSRFRNTMPKNVYKTEKISNLPNNAIYTTKNSDIIKINYPNHNLSIGDSIILQNVLGNHKILSNNIYLFDHYSLMFIYFPDHKISRDFINYYDDYKISIEIINDIGLETTYSNIPVNMISQIYNITLPSIIDKTTPLIPDVYKLFNTNNIKELDKDYIVIELPFNFVAQEGYYYCLPDVFKISFLNIGGIPLYYINADYPINYERHQGYHEIINIDINNIYIKSSVVASSTINSGGNNINIMLILETLAGYPNSNNYTINLKKNFNNVVRIELISTEIPYIDFLIKNSVNNKLYWKHLDDGNIIYQISIPEGNYDNDNLITTINELLNNVPRYNSTTENPNYNIFEVSLNIYTQETKFKCYKKTNLPNSLTAIIEEINNIKYVKITIKHENNLEDVGDIIEISGAIKIGSILDSIFINKSHTIYQTNRINQTYSILIAPLNQITNASVVDLTGNGGPSIVIKTKANVSFLFNKSDTVGNILGFKNVSSANAITNYKSVISNFDPYMLSTNLNQVGNIDTSSKLLNFTGANLYILMYINDYECIIDNSNKIPAFAKILLSGNPGDILFNTFVNYPLEFDFPISTLNELNIKFTYPDGNLVDFRNIDHSFTLRIVEKILTPKNTGLNSKDSSFYEEYKQNLVN